MTFGANNRMGRFADLFVVYVPSISFLLMKKVTAPAEPRLSYKL